MDSKKILLSPEILNAINKVEKKEQQHLAEAEKKAGRQLTLEEKKKATSEYYYQDFVNSFSKKCENPVIYKPHPAVEITYMYLGKPHKS